MCGMMRVCVVAQLWVHSSLCRIFDSKSTPSFISAIPILIAAEEGDYGRFRETHLLDFSAYLG